MILFLIDSSIRAVVLVAGVAAVLRLARVRGSSARHAAWTAVLVAMFFMPAWRIVVPHIVVPGVTVPVSPLASDPTPPPQELTPARPAPGAQGLAASDVPPQTASTSTASATAAVQTATSARSLFPWWRPTLAVIYFAGVVVFLARVVIGWRAMRRVVRSSRRASIQLDDPVYESPAIATPLTVGILTPRIVLPSSWPSWSEDMRTAVLAHEHAHVRRHDALTSMLANLNRCVFWFHPLAWWLERTLATTAEEACDDAGVRAVAEPRRYAEVLVAMAAALRDHGGRVAWQGLGVNGNGTLTNRIERVLQGSASLALSWPKRVMVGSSAAALILLVIACQTQTELRPDPAVAAKVADEQARAARSREQWKTVEAMTPEKAAAMEAELMKNPADLNAHEVLIEYYRLKLTRAEPQRRMDLMRPHALWLIEHHPESKAARQWAMSNSLYKTGDLVGYEAGKKLWLAVLAGPDISATVLRNAVQYFEKWEAPIAEELLLRGRTLGLVDRNYPWPGAWSGELAHLYVNVLQWDIGAFVPRSRQTPYDEHAYALAVRQKLAESTDAILLEAVGYQLLPNSGPGSHGRRGELRDVALRSLERALVINPQAESARRLLANVPAIDRGVRLNWFLSASPGALAKLPELPDEDQFYVLPRMAGSKLNARKGTEADWAQARALADNALALAPKFRNSPDYSSSVFSAEMTLGTLDVRAGQRQAAVAHLLEASEVPPSANVQTSDLRYSPLLVALLKDNERSAVITFLERMAKVTTVPSEQQWLLDSAAKLRKGVMPEWYQRAIGAAAVPATPR